MSLSARTTGDKELLFFSMKKDNLISGLHGTCVEKTKENIVIHLERSYRPPKGVYKEPVSH